MNLLDFIFPKNCLECSRYGQYICEDCIKKVSKGGWWGRNYAVFKYEGVIRKAIIALKYKYSTEIVKELQSYIVTELKKQKFTKSFCLVPIPLYWKRENERGFNQSEIIGKEIAKSMNWKFIPDLLIKTKNTKHQVGLKGEDRCKNLQNVFVVNSDHSPFTIYHSPVIFDDVYTTGSTIKEAVKALENVGYKNIWSLTIAR